MWSVKPNHLVLGIVLCLGLCFTFLVPPFQKPDENRHYYQVSALARGVWSCDRNDAGDPFLPLPKTVHDFPKALKYDELAHTPDFKFFTTQLDWYHYTSSPLVEATDWCSWSFVGYAVPSLGLLIGSLTHSHLVEFYTARLISFIFFFVCVVISLKLSPPRYRRWILFYVLLPMTIHQASSISYDALQLALAPLIFAYVGRFLDAPSSPISHKSFILFILTLLVFVLAKPLSAIFLLLIFLIPKINWRTLIGIFICSVLIVLPFLHPLHYAGLEAGVNPAQQYMVILRDPQYFAQVFVNTISQDSLEMVKGIVGNFGWLDYQLPMLVYLCYLLLFGYLLGTQPPPSKTISLKLWVVLGLVVVGYYLSTYTALYISWTSVGNSVIKGVQGRYFLVILPFFSLILTSLLGAIRSSSKAKIIAISVGGTLLVFSTLLAIYTRYWDYSQYGLSDIGSPDTTMTSAPLSNTTYPLQIDGSAKGVGFYFHLAQNPSFAQTYRYIIKSNGCQETEQIGYFSLPSPDRNLTIIVNTDSYPITSVGSCLQLDKVFQNVDDALVIPEADGLLIHPLYLIPSLTKSSL